jgi:hypothetical protein
MTITRHQLQDFVSYADRLTSDLELLVADLQYSAAGNELSLAVDFSEIHSFLIPDPLEDDWLWPGLPKHIVASVEHSALSRVLTGPPHPVLLPPYAIEFQNFLSQQRSGLQEQAAQAFPAALDSLDALHERPETKALLELASTVQDDGRELTADELEMAVSFFEAHASDLVQLLRRKDPAAQARALLSTHPFRSIESIVTLSITGDEPEVCERFARLRRIRHARDQRGQPPDLEQERRDRERDRSAFLDAVAVEYVKRTNEWFVHERFPARLLLVTRSKNLHRLIEQEAESGKWRKVGYSIVRHPRIFAPLSWHAPRGFLETAQELEATRQSVALFRQSAEFRLRGGTWETLRRTRTDAPLIAMVENLQKQIEALVRIGGSVDDADLLATSESKPRDREVLRLLAMLRSREEVFHAVADRMSTINSDVDLGYVALGFMVESRHGTPQAADAAPATERLVLPRLGPLPYALQFVSAPFAESVTQLRTRGEVPLDHLWRLVLEAVQQPSDHYEALLFMAYLLATMNRWSLAEKYCDRALLSAKQQHRRDRREAMFFRAVCIRQWARAAPRMLEALKQLDEAFLDVERASDPRYLAARGSLKLAWCSRAQREPEKWSMHPVPPLGDCLVDLQAAHALVLASGDVRLQSAVENNICFALCLMYESEPSRELLAQANDSWTRLIETCYRAEADVKRWPVRIIDTVAQGFLLLHDSAHDNALLESLVEALERRHKTELAGDEKELIALNLKRYKDKLVERRAART